MSETLTVFRNQKEVGRLWLDDHNQITFQYSEQWLEEPDAMPLSLGYPLQSEPYEPDQVKPFFRNLLPEDSMRRNIANRLHLSAQDDFHLLEALAGDCMGDLSVCAQNQAPAVHQYQPLSINELDDYFAQSNPLLAGKSGVRLSVSGEAAKLPVYVHDGRMYIPLAGSPSTHYVKGPQTDLKESIENEAFCSRLAKLVDLPVMPGEVIRGKSSYYLVQRSDRTMGADGEISRIHQEDFCQVLKISPELKMEKQGGPSLSDCFSLIRRYSVNPAVDMNSLLKWVMFNYFIGNHKTHSKQAAFILTDEGPRLAPFMDLLSTAVYEGSVQPMAMNIGGEDRPTWVIAKRWESFAKTVKIKPKYVKTMLGTLARQIVVAADKLTEGLIDNPAGEDVIRNIVQTIKSRSRSTLNNLRAAQH